VTTRLAALAFVLTVALAGAAFAAPKKTPKPAPAAADTTRRAAAADTLKRAAADTTLRAAAPDTTSRKAAVPDTTSRRAAADTTRAAVADTARARAPKAALAVPTVEGPPGPKPEEPPLHFTADDMTGSHGDEGDEVLLNGNLHITRGRSVLTANHGRYMRTAGILDLDGKVKMVDSTTTVTCDHASYSENDDLLKLNGNVVVTDRDAVLKAPSGTYDRRNGSADLFDGVQGHDKQQRIVCDRAVYQRDSLLLHAIGNVHAYDDQNRLELTADRVDYDRRSKWANAAGSPKLQVKDDQGKAATIEALSLRLNTETRLAEARDSVYVVRDTMQARADAGRFDDAAQRGWLTGNPRAWDNESRVTGDTLELWTEARKLKRVVVLQNAVMDYSGLRAGNEGETSRLTGDRVDAFVTGNTMDSLVAVGKPRNLYSAPAKPGKTAERNEATGDTITVFFKDKKIDHARVDGSAQGEYRPAVAVNDTAAASHEVIRYDARRIQFEVPKSRIVLDHDAHLTYRDLELNARRVEYDVEAQTLVANGSPKLRDRGDTVDGHLMTYDLGSRVGTIYQATTDYERGLYHGDAIRKVSDNELDVKNGEYTTCNLEDPHYHFSAQWMKIYLKDKLVAKPVVFYVKHVPLLALPFWIFPIKPGRHSGFLFPQFELGFNNRAGQFIRNAGYYWATNDYCDFTVAGDYYQAEPSWVLRGEGIYKLLYVMDGSVRGTFARNEHLKTDDYDINAQHYQELSPNTHLTGQASFISSRDYSTSDLYGRPLGQRLNRFLTSSLAFSHNAAWASLSAVVDRRQDLDADVGITDPDGTGPQHGAATGTYSPSPNLTSDLPNLSLSFPTRTLGSIGPLRGTPWEKRLSTLYASIDANFNDVRTRTGFVAGQDTFSIAGVPDSIAHIDQQQSDRRAFGSSLTLTDSRRPFGWLNLAPRFTGIFDVFDFDQLGNTVVPAAAWNASITGSATYYGLFRPHIGNITGIRHVVFPSVSFSYAPELDNLQYTDANGVTQPRFTPVGDISISSAKQAFMTLGLDQRLQVKLNDKGTVKRLDNLLALSLRSSYNFLWQEQHQLHPFTPISGSFLIQPPGSLSGTTGFTVDPYQGRPLRNLSFYTGYTFQKGHGKPAQTQALPTEQTSQVDLGGFDEDWSIQFAYSYAGGYSIGPNWTTAQTLNMVGRYQFSPGWALEYSSQVDLVTGHVGTQRYGLTRDLHCWTASFTRTFIEGGEAEYYLRIGVKDLKELYVERGTRTGSLGGIQ
jgi:lipopolysaccharide assembly outer membrane protein LptD (OstA)